MGFFDIIGQGISDFFSSIGNAIATAFSNLIGKLLYYITKGLMFIVGLLQQLFDVFSGATKVQYEEKYTYLTDVFFQNQQVKNVYWAIALLGIALAFMFTIIAVVRKMFDMGDKHQNQSMGTILGSACKSIFTMLILSFALTASLSITNLVINRIGYIFDHADSLSRQQEIHFTDEQFAAMGRVYTTIGNYSVNEAYNSRYNLNACFNEIRGDLNYLERQGVFDFVYASNESNADIVYWQDTLQTLVNATDTSRDVPMDKYNEGVSGALLKIMNVIKTNPKFYPRKDYESGYVSVESVGLDRVLFLSGTSSAANNSAYNKDPYLLDGVRGAFYVGEKSIYSIDDVKEAFDIGIGGISYIFIWVLAYFTIRNLLRCIFGCIMRIFNMVSLYIVAPLAIAPMPLDDGEKFRQWTMAMVIQVLGILGTIIPMRLIILFAPIIMMPNLVLFDNGVLNFFGKVLMIVGGLQAVEGFSSMITGILANNTSMASLNAGNAASAMGDQAFGLGKRVVGGTAGFAGGAAADITGLSWVNQKAGGLLSSVGGGMESLGQQGGVIGAIVNKARGGKSDAASGGKPDGSSGAGSNDNTSGGMQTNFGTGSNNNTDGGTPANLGSNTSSGTISDKNSAPKQEYKALEQQQINRRAEERFRENLLKQDPAAYDRKYGKERGANQTSAVEQAANNKQANQTPTDSKNYNYSDAVENFRQEKKTEAKAQNYMDSIGDLNRQIAKEKDPGTQSKLARSRSELLNMFKEDNPEEYQKFFDSGRAFRNDPNESGSTANRSQLKTPPPETIPKPIPKSDLRSTLDKDQSTTPENLRGNNN